VSLPWFCKTDVRSKHGSRKKYKHWTHVMFQVLFSKNIWEPTFCMVDENSHTIKLSRLWMWIKIKWFCQTSKNQLQNVYQNTSRLIFHQRPRSTTQSKTISHFLARNTRSTSTKIAQHYSFLNNKCLTMQHSQMINGFGPLPASSPTKQ